MNLSKKCGLLVTFIILLCARILLPQETVVTYCTGNNSNAFIKIDAPAIYTQLLSRGLTQVNGFIVDYDASVPNEMVEAFNKATEIWSCYLQISRPIRILVKREALGGATLANTETITYRNSLPGLVAGRQYAMALAKQLNSSIVYDDYDITIRFSTSQPWEYNLLGIPVADKFDFISTALHEIAHGLGFSSSLRIENNTGAIGYGGYPVNTGNLVEIFDGFLLKGADRLFSMTNMTALANALQSGNVFFDGANAKKANNGNNAKIYAPTVWAGGSSICHLDDETYGFKNPDSVFLNASMASGTNTAAVIHDPGPITVGILQDMGWNVNRFIAFDKPLANLSFVKGQSIPIKWFDNTPFINTSITFKLYQIINNSYTVLIPNTISGLPNLQVTNPGYTGNEYNWVIPANLPDGTYYLLALGYNPESDFGKSLPFTIGSTPEKPFISPPTGIVPVEVTLTCSTPGAQIRYTQDGTNPSASSTLYSGAISISAPCTLRAKSFLPFLSDSMLQSVESDGFYIASSASEYFKDIYITSEYFTTNSNNDWISGIGLGVGKDPDRNIGRAALRNRIQWIYNPNDVPKGVTVTRTQLTIVLRPKNFNSNVSLRQHNYAGGVNEMIYQNLGSETELVEFNPLTTTKFELPYITSKVQEVVNAGSGTVAIGLQNKNESSSNYMLTGSCDNCSTVVLRVYYLSNTEITQKDADGYQFGHIWLWENAAWQEKQVPYRGVFGIGSQIKARAMQTEKDGSNQKYWKWLNQEDVLNYQNLTVTSDNNRFIASFKETKKNIKIASMVEGYGTVEVSGTSILFTDPWYIDENVPPYGNRNRGMNAIPYIKNAPMDFNNPANANYLGIFANQGFPSWDPPYYSIGFPQGQTYSVAGKLSGKAYLVNWCAFPAEGAEFKFPTNSNTPVIFKEDNTIVYANFKGTQLTNNSSAFSNNSQRKLVKAPNGDIYLAYESMDKVWVEYSTDNGSTWAIANNGNPITTNKSKSPAMDYITYQNGIVVVYQEEYEPLRHLSAIKARFISGTYTDTPVTVFSENSPGTYMNRDYQPVIGIAYGDWGVVVFKSPESNGYTGELLAVPLRVSSDSIAVLSSEVSLPNTNTCSFTPAISANKTISANYDSSNFHLAWCQWSDAQGTNKHIYFQPLQLDITSNLITADEQAFCNVTQRSIKNKNTQPSITSVKKPESNLATARIVWRASSWDSEDSLGSIMFADPLNLTRYWSFGSRGNSPTITLENGNKYFIGWAERAGTGIINYWVDNSLSSSRVKRIENTSSQRLQITGNSTENTAMVVGLEGASAPYYFNSKPLCLYNTAPPLPEGNIKTSSVSGRVFYPDDGGAGFNYTLGDITVNGTPVHFKETSSDLKFTTIADLNQSLQSMPFVLTDNSEFIYSIICSPTEAEYAGDIFPNANSLTFTVQLVDANTEDVLGTYDNIVYNATNTSEYRNLLFDVDCMGIGERQVILRLVVTNTVQSYEVEQDNYIIPIAGEGVAKRLSKEKEDRLQYWLHNGAVAKKSASVKKITFEGKAVHSKQGAAAINSYAIEQNYPNPFNPVTTIHYQLPKAGIVTVKIYDMLGKEVQVLVNEYKESGRYRVEFNGANLASGVYMYRIDCNDFHAVKKLTLLK